ncbi:MAG: hypothetical protein LBN01_00415 [Endomicrobium sp.]|jgi:hypothetical protein|nr:hypothetical protein [Endomicrobium sp.]
MKKNIVVLLCLMFIGQNAFAFDWLCPQCVADRNYYYKSWSNCATARNNCYKLRDNCTESKAELQKNNDRWKSATFMAGIGLIGIAVGVGAYVHRVNANERRLNAIIQEREDY